MRDPLHIGARVHFMGIGGYGINPIARVMHELGYAVSGCDLNESPLLTPLQEMGIPVEVGHSPAHLDRYAPQALVISSAIPPDNSEVWAAIERGLPVFKRADILGALMQQRLGIAIAGTHGKTTTTAMTVSVLVGCEQDPTFIVGGVLRDLGTNARAGSGEAFIVEADEYDRMFMGLCPHIAVITTIEMDHPDMFATLADVRALFEEFAALLSEDGLLICGYDNEEARRIAEGRRAQGRPAITYGLLGGDWTAAEVLPNQQGGMDFVACYGGQPLVEVSLLVPGTHNVQNALAALAVADALRLPLEQAAAALGSFSGVGRRFELRGEVQNVAIIDDYAHHPTAIRATLAAVRLRYPARPIWAVWQPHTYSRTKALLDEFAASFAEADHVIITDVFRSRDTETFGIGPQDVLARMGYHRDARHIGDLDDVVEFLALNVRPGDVVIVMSAGDATRVSDNLLAILGGG